MYRKLGLLQNILGQFEGVLTVPDGALSPSLRSVFIIVEKYLTTLRSHLAPINRVTYHPRIFYFILFYLIFSFLLPFFISAYTCWCVRPKFTIID
jgi:hypothetical protein